MTESLKWIIFPSSFSRGIMLNFTAVIHLCKHSLHNVFRENIHDNLKSRSGSVLGKIFNYVIRQLSFCSEIINSGKFFKKIWVNAMHNFQSQCENGNKYAKIMCKEKDFR